MSRRSKFQSLISGSADWPPLIDVGTNSLTGFRRGEGSPYNSLPLSNTTLNVAALTERETAPFASDFARIGFLFDPPELDDDDTFTDAFGVRHLFADGMASPLEHPLEAASSASQLAGHKRPNWRLSIAAPTNPDLIAIAETPCPGLLDQALAMRGSWKLLDDLTENWRNASALFDWALENIVASYEALLEASPVCPDVIIYADDIGFKDSMFLSEADFRRFMKPRLATLFSRLRKLCDAPILFHSCGAIAPVLGDIVDLGIDILNVDTFARGMDIGEVRRRIPANLPLHGITALDFLGAAVRKNETDAARFYASHFMQAWPAILAPADSLPPSTDPVDIAAALYVIRSLDPDRVARGGDAAFERTLESANRLVDESTVAERNRQTTDDRLRSERIPGVSS